MPEEGPAGSPVLAASQALVSNEDATQGPGASLAWRRRRIPGRLDYFSRDFLTGITARFSAITAHTGHFDTGRQMQASVDFG